MRTTAKLDTHVFFVGPRKTGTTTFHDILRCQGFPMPAGIKETFFFERETVDLAEYQRLYAIDPRQPFIEVSPSYFTSGVAIEHLLRLFPDARIIITLRHPVQRAISALRHGERIGQIEAPITAEAIASNKHVRNVLKGSAYHEHVSSWAQAFPGRVLQVRQNAKGEYVEATVDAMTAMIAPEASLRNVRSTRSNPGRVVRSPQVFSVARRLKVALRAVGAHELVNLLKRHDGVFYKSATSVDYDLATTQALEEALRPSIDYYAAAPEAVMLGRPVELETQ